MSNGKVLVEEFRIENDIIEIDYYFEFQKSPKSKSTKVQSARFEAFLLNEGKIGNLEFDYPMSHPDDPSGRNGDTYNEEVTFENYMQFNQEINQDLEAFLASNPPSNAKSSLFKAAWDLAKSQYLSFGEALKIAWLSFRVIGKTTSFEFFKSDGKYRKVFGQVLGFKGRVVLYKEADQIKSFRIDRFVGYAE